MQQRIVPGQLWRRGAESKQKPEDTMSDPTARTEIHALSLQNGHQCRSHDDGGHTEGDGTPTLAPDPISILGLRIPKSLDRKIPSRGRSKQHLENGQKEFANGYVG